MTTVVMFMFILLKPDHLLTAHLEKEKVSEQSSLVLALYTKHFRVRNNFFLNDSRKQ